MKNGQKLNIKKWLFIIVINIVLFFTILVLADMCVVYKQTIDRTKEVREYNEILVSNKSTVNIDLPEFHYTLRNPSFKEHFKNESKDFANERRVSRPENIDKTKGSIIIFGDSFAEGAFLHDNETLNAQLSNLTGRVVYNRGFSGTGPAVLLFQTRLDDFYKDIDIAPDYAIYTFIPNHFYRTFWGKYGSANTSNIPYIGYKEINGTLVEDYTFLHNICRLTFLRRRIETFAEQNMRKDLNKTFDIVKLHFEEARKELTKRYPNIKFIILKHPQFRLEGELDIILYQSERWDELRNEGFIIYDLEKDLGVDVLALDYALPDSHPNANLWNLVSHKLKNDLNL